jgi:hypothetical protein
MNFYTHVVYILTYKHVFFQNFLKHKSLNLNFSKIKGPGQPSETPSETPPTTPDIDVPSPSQPGVDPSPTPISPVG